MCRSWKALPHTHLAGWFTHLAVDLNGLPSSSFALKITSFPSQMDLTHATPLNWMTQWWLALNPVRLSSSLLHYCNILCIPLSRVRPRCSLHKAFEMTPPHSITFICVGIPCYPLHAPAVVSFVLSSPSCALADYTMTRPCGTSKRGACHGVGRMTTSPEKDKKSINGYDDRITTPV